MIPYALLMLKLTLQNGENWEVRAIDFLMNGVTLRLLPEQAAQIADVAYVTANFYHLKEKFYIAVKIADFTLMAEKDEETEALGAMYYRLETDDLQFLNALNHLGDELTEYITLRETEGEAALLSTYSGAEIPENYDRDAATWIKGNVGNTPQWTDPLKSVEIAVSLDDPELVSDFLKQDRVEFLNVYWRKNSLSTHPIAQESVTHLYIGSAFCPFLFPKVSQIESISIKCLAENFSPVWVFSPMAERMTEKYRKIVQKIMEMTAGKTEIVFNDWGFPVMLKEMAENGEIAFNRISLTAGVLLNKRKKDPRLFMLNNVQSIEKANFETAVTGEVFRNSALKRWGVERFSHEVTGYRIAVTPGDVLHLPLYETNLSSFCTLYAVMHNGRRGHTEAIDHCPQYCRLVNFLYTEKMHLIGRGNALFGCSMRELNDVQILNDFISRGIKRLVVRL